MPGVGSRPAWNREGPRGCDFGLFSLLAAECGGNPEPSGDGTSSTRGSGHQEGTLASWWPDGPETTGEAPHPEATLDPAPNAPAVLLRLEGDPGTTFSGICAVGGMESVLSGRIPKRYAFGPRGQRRSCRIEKQDQCGGAPRVILVAGDTTRSVQQTNSRGGVIRISYAGG